MRLKNIKSLPNPLTLLTLASLALALQMQFKVFKSDDFFGLRINLADVILPLVGLGILISLIRKTSHWPRFVNPFSALWPLAMTGMIAFGLLYGYHLSGAFNTWAFLNKGIGWLVVMAYFAAGAWITTNHNDTSLKYFIWPFISFTLVTTLTYILIQIGYSYFSEIMPTAFFNLNGLMGNRNAFAFLFMAAACITNILFLLKSPLINKNTVIVFWFIAPAFFLLNGSRSMWIIALCFIAYLFILNFRRTVKHILPWMLIGSISFFAISKPAYEMVFDRHIKISKDLYKYTEASLHAEKSLPLNDGDLMRFKVMRTAFNAWTERPILGNGLGGSLRAQEDEYGKALIVVHNSLLWIMTDMGLLGLAIFLGAFITMLKALYSTPAKDTEISRFRHAALTILVVFGLLSLFHEMIYTRFMWFILGLALAAPNSEPEPDQT